MRGAIPDVHPVISHLLRAAQQIREDAAGALSGLAPEQIWSKPHGMTSAGFHVKHLAGSAERLCTYLAGNALTPEQLAAIKEESNGSESAGELLKLLDHALDRYEQMLQALKPEQFGEIRFIGRKRYEATAVAIAIHIAEHSQRHIGGLIAVANFLRRESTT